MAFSDEVKSLAFGHAAGRCECTREGHGHVGKCNKPLTLFSATFRHRLAPAAGGSDSAPNCEVLCPQCGASADSGGGAPP
jgi:hypothetical protein